MVLAPIVALAAVLRWSRWPRFAIGIGIGIGGVFRRLTGAEPSVMRARLMAGLALIGVLLAGSPFAQCPVTRRAQTPNERRGRTSSS
jgi:Competence protein